MNPQFGSGGKEGSVEGQRRSSKEGREMVRRFGTSGTSIEGKRRSNEGKTCETKGTTIIKLSHCFHQWNKVGLLCTFQKKKVIGQQLIISRKRVEK